MYAFNACGSWCAEMLQQLTRPSLPMSEHIQQHTIALLRIDCF